LDEGRRQIDIAVSLDPDNSLMRSYLGKAYFEEKRDNQAALQLEMAKQLDPNDPTPYFYDAIRKQTTNRPVEALQDMQKAIELNDNRAIYRSRFLLDEDLAARTASLGRIYNDLGFQELGLVEGWKSVNIDPSNYSAHRLLADNYAALPRHEIARVSELLQSQLLQPINLTPVQPVLAESNLLLVEGGGPSSASFNEFNPLFTRNRLALQLSGIFGSRYTFGDEVTQSGVWNNLSYSVGQFHFQTDGFRKNTDLNVNIYNAFVQAKISPHISVQAEFRHRDVESGSLDSLFSRTADTVRRERSFRQESDSETYRLGLRVSPTQRSDFLASYIYVDEDARFKFRPDPASFTPSEGYVAETQYRYRHGIFSAIVGGGYYTADEDTEDLGLPTLKERTKHSNGYLYTRLQSPSPLVWTVGFSGDVYDTRDSEGFRDRKSRLNPKAGVLWNIGRQTLVRAAWFRTFKRSFLFNQTLEPTQVAGFNQFFDDIRATEAERWGLGIDHRFNPVLTGGIEVSERDLRVPTGDVKERWKESLYRAYLQVTPHPRWAFELEYSRENFKNFDSTTPRDTQTQIIPFTVAYFSPSGFFAKLRASYLKQKVALATEPDSDRATFLDLNLGYRLPRRLGILEVQFQNMLNQHYRYEGLHERQSPARTGLPSALPFPPEFTVLFRFNLAF
jgi:tetratricopeptide (TPR) repeat protein